MSITTIGNQLIHYEVLGRGPVLLFIHGWLGSWRYWWPSMQAMSSQHRSFAFDLFGFGDSSKSSDAYSIDSYVDMVDQFIDQLGVARPVYIIGHSLGAAVGLRYLQKNPENVEKLVSVALPVSGKYINNRLEESDPETAVNRLLGKSNSYSEVDTELRKTDQQAYLKLLHEMGNIDFTELLEDLPKPVLLLYGDQDPIVQIPDGDEEFLRISENNRYFVSLECHHFPMLQYKREFNRLLLEFILAGDDLTDLAPKEYWSRRTR